MLTRKIAIITVSLFVFTTCGKDKYTTVKELKSKSGIDIVFLPGGTFMMGGERAGEAPVHSVYVSSFYIDKYEVTQEMYARLDFPNRSHFKGSRRPVERVAWMSAAIYCNQRSIEEGYDPSYDENTWECNYSKNGYRLPTEAEWEYAARSGTTGKHFFGESGDMGEYAVYSRNSPGKTTVVGSKKPNAWGLHDMYGNVAEWCNDFYSSRYYENSAESNPRGPGEGNERVVRGGSWNDPDTVIYSGSRGFDSSLGFDIPQESEETFSDAYILRDTIGFRCVRRGD